MAQREEERVMGEGVPYISYTGMYRLGLVARERGKI